MNFDVNLAKALAHSLVFFSREEWAPVADAVNQGYNIPISLAISNPLQNDPFLEADNNVFFGNGNENAPSTTAEPGQSSSATVAASEQGPASASGEAVTAPGGAAGAAAASSSSDLLWWIIIGGVAVVGAVVLFIFRKKL